MTNSNLKPYRFQYLKEAEAFHEKSGGILLITGTKASVCCGCMVDKKCQCRDDDYVNSLAPSWSEADPDNINKLPSIQIAQQNLFN